MIDWLLEPFQLEFMRTALFASLLVTLATASVGVHVVLRRMSFVGHAVSHAVLPGVVVAILWGGSILVGALAAGLLTAVVIGLVSARGRISEDTAIGVVLSGMFALGVLLMSRTGDFGDLTHILFGNILAVQPGDLIPLAVIAAIVLLGLTLFHKELELTAADPTHAAAIGIRGDWIRMGLLVLIAPTIVAGVDVVGIILVAAMLVTPAAAAGLLVHRVVPMMFVSVAIGMTSGALGLLISYHAGGSSGAAIVLVATGFFVVAWVVSAVRGALTRRGGLHHHAAAEAPEVGQETVETAPTAAPTESAVREQSET